MCLWTVYYALQTGELGLEKKDRLSGVKKGIIGRAEEKDKADNDDLQLCSCMLPKHSNLQGGDNAGHVSNLQLVLP